MTTDTSPPPTGPASVCAAFQEMVALRGDAIAVRSSDGAAELTWPELAERVRRLAGGLAALGVGRGDTVGLLMANRPEFHVADTAAMHLGAIPFSIYATLPAGEIAHLLGNADCRVVIAETTYLDRLREAAADLDHPVTLIALEGGGDGPSLDEVEARGADDFDFEAAWRAVGPDDVLTLIYTSGTTGPPKGVEITHGGMLAEVRLVAERLSIEAGDTVTSYLPSAHIADRWLCHYNFLARGLEITCVADGARVAGVLPELRPTVWGGVPRVFEKLVAGIEASIAAEPDEGRRAAVRRAIEVGIEVVRAGEEGREPDAALAGEHATAEEAILAPLRRRIGLDRAKWIICGAAPLARRVHEFLLALGLPMVELYGMSETSCVLSVDAPGDARIGTVGRLIPEIEARVAEDGELLVAGPTVMAGYRADPVRTAEVLSDGWLHTGDVATFDDEGRLRIVDRKKELIINAAGKNMSPANIELELKAASSLIGQAVAIGDGRRHVTALLVLDPELARAHAREHGLPDGSLAGIAADPGVRARIGEAVDTANARLSRVEQVRGWTLLDEEWLPGGDELTPTMKVRRRVVDRKYASVIDGLYEERP